MKKTYKKIYNGWTRRYDKENKTTTRYYDKGTIKNPETCGTITITKKENNTELNIHYGTQHIIMTVNKNVINNQTDEAIILKTERILQQIQR